MASKKLINSINDVVDENLSGLCATYPHLDCHAAKRVVLSSSWDSDRREGKKVAIICGGGSGHEPFAAGFVGNGMLSASIAGNVFAAPPPNHILHAIKCATGNAGTLVVIPNYTGDCLNFGIAIEKAKQDGLKILDIVVGDDCSIPDDKLGRAGKRGLVGMLFVIKIAGALTTVGQRLEKVYDHAKAIADNTATYGVGLRVGSLPGQGQMFKLPDDEIEIGLGVHGEAGYDRIKIKNAHQVVEIMLESINKALVLTPHDDVAIIINNFGASSQLEQGIVVNEVVTQLKKRMINTLRVYSGMLMTSLDSAGMHISILKIPKCNRDLYISCLDATTDAPNWPGCVYSVPGEPRAEYEEEKRQNVKKLGKKLNEPATKLVEECLRSACNRIIANETELNSLDRGCGDGDCGFTHKKLADGILESLESLETSYPASLLTQLSWIAEECMGGTSGAVYSLMFTTAAAALAKVDDKKEVEWETVWDEAWRCAIDGIMKYSKARPGDRTMLDSMIPAHQIYSDRIRKNASYKEAIKKAANAAEIGCQATKKMIPKAGRAAYVKQSEYLNNVDAGAHGVVVWLNAISEIIQNHS